MKRSILIALAVALLASCATKEIDVQAPAQDDVEFYASFEQPAEDGTRVYANEDLLLRWTADDRVSIFDKNTYNWQYRFLGETGDNAGDFGKVQGAEYMTGNEISNVVSVYPYQKTTKISESEVITVTLPAEQAYAENTFGLGANTMVSVSSDNFLQFKNVGGYLMLKLYGEGVSVKSITLKGNNGEKLAGKASVTMPLDGVPSVTMASDATEEITLSCETPIQLGTTGDNSIQFWFVVPPMTFSKGFTISITDADERHFEKSTNKSIAIERNKLAKMTPLEIEMKNAFIVFADPVVKSICIENWDTDGDGELSYEEAAAVTDIGDVFAQNDQITSFNELQYFTGLRTIGRPTTINTGYYGFRLCTNLAAVTLPNTLTGIGVAAFHSCRALKSIDIPASVETIGEGAFYQSGLVSIDLPEGVTIWDAAFLMTDITSLTIPRSTMVIKNSDYAFPFSECRSLSSVTLNGPISIIINGWDYNAYPDYYSNADPLFTCCENLKTLYIGADFSFDGKMPLGYALGTGGYDAPDYGVGYETISVSPENQEYDSRNNCNAIIETASNTLLLGCKNTVIPESVTAIGPWALSGIEASSITIPGSVLAIGDNAIGSSSLASIIVKATVPPTLGRNGLGGSSYDFPIYVPASSVSAYKTAEGWIDYADRIHAIVPLPEVVDLGLSVKWASFNLGATKPEEYGDYYAWGETEPKEEYTWANYKWCMGTYDSLTKYCGQSEKGYNGFTDGKTVIDPEDDAAHVTLGGKWRMPTDAELTELRTQCTWEWTSVNGINGRKVTGPNGNSIFLPAAGFIAESGAANVNYYAYYWSTLLYNEFHYNAWILTFYSGNVTRFYMGRRSGLSIRPVYAE